MTQKTKTLKEEAILEIHRREVLRDFKQSLLKRIEGERGKIKNPYGKRAKLYKWQTGRISGFNQALDKVKELLKEK